MYFLCLTTYNTFNTTLYGNSVHCETWHNCFFLAMNKSRGKYRFFCHRLPDKERGRQLEGLGAFDTIIGGVGGVSTDSQGGQSIRKK